MKRVLYTAPLRTACHRTACPHRTAPLALALPEGLGLGLGLAGAGGAEPRQTHLFTTELTGFFTVLWLEKFAK
jgi:hypothetical protein